MDTCRPPFSSIISWDLVVERGGVSRRQALCLYELRATVHRSPQQSFGAFRLFRVDGVLQVLALPIRWMTCALKAIDALRTLTICSDFFCNSRSGRSLHPKRFADDTVVASTRHSLICPDIINLGDLCGAVRQQHHQQWNSQSP